MRKAGKEVPAELLEAIGEAPKAAEAGNDDMAAVAVALDLYYGKHAPTLVTTTCGTMMLNDGRRHATDWNRKIYGMNNLM